MNGMPVLLRLLFNQIKLFWLSFLEHGQYRGNHGHVARALLLNIHVAHDRWYILSIPCALLNDHAFDCLHDELCDRCWNASTTLSVMVRRSISATTNVSKRSELGRRTSFSRRLRVLRRLLSVTSAMRQSAVTSTLILLDKCRRLSASRLVHPTLLLDFCHSPHITYKISK